MSHSQTDPLAMANAALPKATPRLHEPTLRFALAALAMSGVAAAAGMALVGRDAGALGLVLGGYVTGASLATALMRRGYPHDRLGLCNLVTLLRMSLVAAMLAPLAGSADPWAVLALAVIAFALDGVDGWLARREGRVSEFGSRFDMEVDSALAMILAVNAWAAGTAGALVLLIGAPRYLFAAAGSALPWLARPLPERRSRKFVCVVQIATLIGLQMPPLTARLADPVILAVAAMLIWSFGRDVLWLWRARP